MKYRKWQVEKPPERELAFWKTKTIRLGTGIKTAEDFRHTLNLGEFRLEDNASDILGKRAFTVATKETKVNLVTVPIGGKQGWGPQNFLDNFRPHTIYDRVKKFGLGLCPPEVGPQLRLQYQNQPNNESILVAMEPIINSGGYPCVFIVNRYGSKLRLSTTSWLRDWSFLADDHRFLYYTDGFPWVFRRMK